MIFFALAFGFLTIGVLLMLIAKSLKWYIKLIPVIVLPWLAFAVWQTSQPPQGWPASLALPKDVQFQWGVIREPDITIHDKGEIDIWATPVGSDKPRAYKLPYSRKLHTQVQGAINRTKHGSRVHIKQQGKKTKGGSTSGQGGRGSHLVFYKEPPTHLPHKHP